MWVALVQLWFKWLFHTFDLKTNTMDAIALAYAAFCEERFPLPSERDVSALERHLGIAFPVDFRKYIKDYNGGFFSEPAFRGPNPECPDCLLSLMHGIRATDKCAELGSDADMVLFSDNDPIQVLPIGATAGGNLLLLLLDPEHFGEIVLKPISSQQCYFLASGIQEFFSLLRENPDE
jgi:hypothetical protein